MRDRVQIVDHVEKQGISMEDFNTNLAHYSGCIDTKEERIKKITDFGMTIKDYLADYHEIAVEPEKEIDSFMKVSVKSDKNTEFTLQGIEKAWEADDINQGNPRLLVTKANQVDPNDNTGPAGFIAISEVTEDQLKEKINYATRQNPDGPSVMLVGEGPHWSILVIDPRERAYRYVDSDAQEMSPILKEKLNKVIGADYRDISEEPSMKTPTSQQSDDVSCGTWAIRNAQSIAQGGIRAAMYYDDSKEAREAEISNLNLRVQNKLADTVITSIQRDQHRRAFRGIAAELTMRTGIRNATEISPPTATRIVKPKEEGLSVV